MNQGHFCKESTRRWRHRLWLGAFVCLFVFPFDAVAQLRVTAVDWVQGRPEIPHIAINGAPTMLQAVAEGGGCGGNYQYRWDWNGDGDFNDANEEFRNASSANYGGYFAPLELDVQYPEAEGDRAYFAKIEVNCAGQTVTDDFPVFIRAERLCPNYPENEDCAVGQNLGLTRQVHTDRAVDRALWWMFKRFTHYGDDSRGVNVHTCVFNGTPAMYGHGHALNAFLRRSHGHGQGRETDVYYRHVTQCGLNALASSYTMSAGLWFDDNPNAGRGGERIEYTDGRLGAQENYASYASTAWVEPLANFGDPNYRLPGGEANIRNRTLADVGQDLADGLIYCAGEDGGWYYTCRNGNGSTSDASTNGWAPEALRLLERKFGTETYGWAKDRQRTWLNDVCNAGDNANDDLYGCSYHVHGPAGKRGKLAGNALVGYGWTENQRWTTAGDPGAQMRNHWIAATRLDHENWGLYYMYATTKGMRSFVPEVTYFEDGRDWAAEFGRSLMQRQFADGHWQWCSSENDDCFWPWKNNIDGQTSTALVTQIVQSWLEAQAFARATPQESGPGIDITFDHSLSHVLDPSVSLTRFRWNTVDAPGDDQNNDGIVTPDEMVWEFETDDINEVFVYRFDDELGWGEVVKKKVTLGVTDSEGRTVYDDKSVEITLSLANHAPTIVGHPNGPNASYRAYLGTPVDIDPRETYDVDTEHEVYPGDNARPQGLPDRVTSIAVDLNLDGDYDDDGEDAFLEPVIFVPRPGQALGDRVAVPIRACDDGRWNGECYERGDGAPNRYTFDDCSICAYGTVSVEVVENIEPPIFRAGANPYEAIPETPIELDLSGCEDPEGVLGMRFEYELVAGEGELRPTPGYEGDLADMGPNPIYIPSGDGRRVDRIRVIVTDAGGASTEGEVRVEVANVPPIIDNWAIRYVGRTPNILGPLTATNLGNGRYRATLRAAPDPRWDLWVDYQTRELFEEPLTTWLDIDPAGNADVAGEGTVGSVGPLLVDPQSNRTLTFAVWDGDDRVQETREVQTPASDPTIQYFFDVGGDGSFEVAGGGQGVVEFDAEAGAQTQRITGFIRGAGGESVAFDQNVPLVNADPQFEVARILQADQEAFRVIISYGADDPDGDSLRYTIDWGDGTPAPTTRSTIAEHGYAENQHRAYTITITATDGRGGRAVQRLEVDFPAPAQNRAPSFEIARLLSQTGFDVVVAVSARDPDNDVLTYTFDWGDGTPNTSNVGGVADHAYRAGDFRAYTITITADDGQGGFDRAQIEIDFPPPPDNRAPVFDLAEIISEDGFDIVVAASAIDPDGDVVTYTFDWGDGSDPTESVGGVTAHSYAEGEFREYLITVTADDGRGGVDTAQIPIDFPPPPENEVPVFDLAEIIGQDGFEVVVAVNAVDPDDDDLTYTFDWGDDSEPTSNRGGLAEHAYPVDVYRAYTIVVTADDGFGGIAETRIEVDFPEPDPNERPAFEGPPIVLKDGFEVVVTAQARDPDGDRLTYTFNWGDESPRTRNEGGVATHVYPAGRFLTYTLAITAEDGRGGVAEQRVEIDFPAPPDNQAPVFDAAEIIDVDAFDVVVSVNAVDPDDDALTYRFDFGDNSPAVVRAGGVVQHSYPVGVYRAYTITIVADDGRGGTDTEVLEIDFPEPAANVEPTVDRVELLRQDGFLVVVNAPASDPDNDPLELTFDWGDGTATTQAGAVASHEYPADVYRQYVVTVTADDGRGGRDQETLTVEFVEPDPNVAPRFERDAVVRVDGFGVVVDVSAIDPDGDALTYTFDWGDDTPETSNAGGVAAHDYEQNVYRPYTVTVTATDGRGGEAVQTIEIDFPPPPDNVPPAFESAGIIAQEGFEVVVSASAPDPDGDVVQYTFDWDDGTPVTRQFGGVATHTFPAGIYRDYTITITADDRRGGVVNTVVVVDFPEPPPNIAPVITNFSVLEQAGFVVTMNTQAIDEDDDPLVVTIDWGDGTTTENAGGVAAHTYPEGIYRAYTITATVVDGREGSDTATVEVVFEEPAPNQPPVFELVRLLNQADWQVDIAVSAVDPDGDALEYEFIWDDDTPNTVMEGGIAQHRYAENVYRTYTVRIVARDGRGGTVEDTLEIDFPAPPDNVPPVIEEFRIVDQGNFEVTAVAGAVDADGDGLVYTIDWGDETAPSVNRTGVASHVYPEGEYETYTVTLTVDDGRGGVVQTQSVMDYPPPPENEPPVVNDIQLDIGARGDVEIVIDAFDPEGGRLTLDVHWGDEADANTVAAVVGGRATHRYVLPEDGEAYNAYILATDPEGLRTRARFRVAIVDNATVIRDVNVDFLGGGAVRASVSAEDADGLGLLSYSFDFDNDGRFEAESQASTSSFHAYPVAGEYQLRVRVQDTWSGQFVERLVPIVLDEWVAENQAPIVRRVSVRVFPGGRATLAVDAWDPENQPLTIRVHWGDEADPLGVVPMVGGQAEHSYAYRGDVPYAGFVEVIDAGGLSARNVFNVDLVDRPTEIDGVNASLLGEGNVLVTVAARDEDRQSLLYAFDFDSDGAWEVVDRPDGSMVHNYPTHGDYDVTVRVTDPWSGVHTTEQMQVEIPQWVADNSPPEIDDVLVTVEPRGQVTVTVDVRDADGDPLDIRVRWGDEAPAEEETDIIGREGTHQYAFPEHAEPYEGYVRVLDGQGADVIADFEVSIIDRPTVIRGVSSDRVRANTWLFEVLATDDDGADALVYSFDFTNDGVWDVVDAQSSSVVHVFEERGNREVRVGVRDTWSGTLTEEIVVVAPEENLPPVIHFVSLDVQTGGHADLLVDASDPEGGRLSMEVMWGDEAEGVGFLPVVGFDIHHIYDYRPDEGPYMGRVRVSDPDGGSTEASFQAQIYDARTQINEVSVNHVENGTVSIRVVADDLDTEALLYDFDVDGDGVLEASDQNDASIIHTYDAAGVKTVVVGVTDPWSGIRSEVQRDFILDPWVEPSPLPDQFLEGTEGECIVFRIGQLGDVGTKVDDSVCDRDEHPDMDLWTWTFGDGETADGSEVGHRYDDDGVYSVVVENRDPNRPRRSLIQMTIENAPPVFESTPHELVEAGETYLYEVELSDRGPTDELRLELVEGPEGMVLEALDGNHWMVKWTVAEDHEGGTADVSLRATDGHTTAEGWVPDGAEVWQRYSVRVTGDLDPVFEMDAFIPAPDAAPSLSSYSGDDLSCAANSTGNEVEFVLLGLVFAAVFGRRRRR